MGRRRRQLRRPRPRVFRVTGSLGTLQAALQGGTDEVIEAELSQRDDGSFYLYVRGGTHRRRRPPRRREPSRQGPRPMMPVEFPNVSSSCDCARDVDHAFETVIGPGEYVRRALDELPDAFDDGPSCASIGGPMLSTPLRRHRRCAHRPPVRAVKPPSTVAGREEPRSGASPDVAEALGCAPGTAAEHL